MSYAKSKGGLGFRNLHGFNIALLGKHIWNFMQNPSSLVARVFKGRYFPDTHVLKAGKGQGSSFIWSGIWTVKEELAKGFPWVLGSGEDIVATRDPWLRNKRNFQVEQNQFYAGRDEKVYSLFLPGEKKWNTDLIQRNFLKEDAEAIIALPIPQRTVADRIVWANSNDGVYTAKHAYHFWYDAHFGNNIVPQCTGWKNIWHLKLPHKIKVFVWRFCRNAIPVRRRLSSKGVRVPITCPMCTVDIEHMSHLFYDCSFAVGCWNHVGLVYDWSQVEFAPDWLLQKLSSATNEEKVKICVVLWGIWYWRNKRVWEGKVVTPGFAMDSSFQVQSDWTQARKKQETNDPGRTDGRRARQMSSAKWQLPVAGVFKVNVDASVYPGTNAFSIGMVMRNDEGNFMAAKTSKFCGEVSVVEAESVGVREALSWIKELQMQDDEIVVESDSQLTVNAIQKQSINYLEVGEIVESCKQILHSLSRVSVVFIRKNANRVAHEVARIPCLVNSYNVFTSPPTCLLEALAYDVLI